MHYLRDTHSVWHIYSASSWRSLRNEKREATAKRWWWRPNLADLIHSGRCPRTKVERSGGRLIAVVEIQAIASGADPEQSRMVASLDLEDSPDAAF